MYPWLRHRVVPMAPQPGRIAVESLVARRPERMQEAHVRAGASAWQRSAHAMHEADSGTKDSQRRYSSAARVKGAIGGCTDAEQSCVEHGDDSDRAVNP